MSLGLKKNTIDISKFEIKTKNNPNINTNIAVIGLGATGSSFMLLLSHFLKYSDHYVISLFDFDHIEPRNREVSMYGFANSMGIRLDRHSKVSSSYVILNRLAGRDNIDGNNGLKRTNKVNYYNQKVTSELLEHMFGNKVNLDVIMIFTDNNESRYEVSQYHLKFPKSEIFDVRIGSYDQFEVYYSANPDKYLQTIYFEDDGSITHIETNNVCQDERMHFSIAMAGSSMLMNLFTKWTRNELKTDFKHIMFGRDYIGEVKGYV